MSVSVYRILNFPVAAENPDPAVAAVVMPESLPCLNGEDSLLPLLLVLAPVVNLEDTIFSGRADVDRGGEAAAANWARDVSGDELKSRCILSFVGCCCGGGSSA